MIGFNIKYNLDYLICNCHFTMIMSPCNKICFYIVMIICLLLNMIENTQSTSIGSLRDEGSFFSLQDTRNLNLILTETTIPYSNLTRYLEAKEMHWISISQINFIPSSQISVFIFTLVITQIFLYLKEKFFITSILHLIVIPNAFC